MQLTKDMGAVVSGGASGLGEATARMLAAAGVKVAILDLDETRGRRVAEEIGGVFCACDVTSVEAVDAALKTAREAHGQERIAVACAGIAPGQKTAGRDRKTGEIRPHDAGLFQKTIMVNLVGTFHLASRSAAGMLTLDPVTEDGERGVVVTTSSVAAEDGQIGQIAYAASKGAIASMTLPMARDLSRDGVRVVSILPGLFHTPMFDGLGEEVRASLAANIPFPTRLGRADEYAALVRQICENSMLNGTTIRLDGAVRLAPK